MMFNSLAFHLLLAIMLQTNYNQIISNPNFPGAETEAQKVKRFAGGT